MRTKPALQLAASKLHVSRLRPRMVDPLMFTIVAVTFGVGVMFATWHSKTLNLEVDTSNLGWVLLVGFGMAWQGEWGSGWRVGTGLVFGSVAGTAAYFASLATLPITPFGLGLGLGFIAMCVAFGSHMYPRVITFAGAAVGFGIGLGTSRSLALRASTPIDDILTLMLTTSLALVLGVVGSLALRAFVLRLGREGPEDSHLVRMAHRWVRADIKSKTNAKPKAKATAGASR